MGEQLKKEQDKEKREEIKSALTRLVSCLTWQQPKIKKIKLWLFCKKKTRNNKSNHMMTMKGKKSWTRSWKKWLCKMPKRAKRLISLTRVIYEYFDLQGSVVFNNIKNDCYITRLNKNNEIFIKFWIRTVILVIFLMNHRSLL